MCGINGIIFKTSKTDVSKILKMNALLDHRGPDDSGFINHKNLLLGHTRLSIIDISNLGSQPMSVDGRYWIIYNGEIYNYKTLREELILKKYKFYSNSDTEVVLNAYKEWGVDSFQKFNGEWSFAILDKKHNENPGTILTTSNNIQIACSKNTIFQINSLKKSGKKSMSAKEFLNGHNLNVGEVID